MKSNKKKDLSHESMKNLNREIVTCVRCGKRFIGEWGIKCPACRKMDLRRFNARFRKNRDNGGL